MALDFARNTTEHKELWPRFRIKTELQGTFVSCVCGFILLNYLTEFLALRTKRAWYCTTTHYNTVS